jgi:hypothetical protein
VATGEAAEVKATVNPAGELPLAKEGTGAETSTELSAAHVMIALAGITVPAGVLISPNVPVADGRIAAIVAPS